MDDSCRIALYARVSSQRQAEEATIQSQVAALEQRIAAEQLRLDAERRFLDDGYSGATLQRPGLERLRDLIHAGGVERLYVHSPDRLARKFVHQAVLLEEFAKRHVEVVFLNQPPADASAEGNLLLQMQGMIAEYERAKILERTRRGRRFNARQGRVSVLGHAPYGYRYITKHAGDGEARYDVVRDEARVVRDLFRWVGLEGLSLGQAARRLTARHVPTRTGAASWNRATVRGLLLNPAYAGEAHWGKTRLETRSPHARPRRGQPDVPRRDKVARPTPRSEREIIAVPALISKELFAAAAERLADNRRRQRPAEASFLLSGLLVCGQCGSAFCGRRHRRHGKTHVYYRCLGTDRYRHGGDALCASAAVAAVCEDDIWTDACALLQDPERLRQELQRRQQASPAAPTDAASLRTSIAGLKRQLGRLRDMYEMGYLDKTDFQSRAQRAQARLAREERAYADQRQARQHAQEQHALRTDFEHFAQQMKTGLKHADFRTKRKILGLLIKRIEVQDDQMHIVYKVQPRPFAPSPTGGGLHYRLRCVRSGARARGHRSRPRSAPKTPRRG